MPTRAFLITALACATVTAQDLEPQTPKAAIRAWVASDHGDRALLDRATAAVLRAGDAGLRALADEVRATGPDQRERRVGVESLVTGVVIGSLQRGVESGMRFAGQYDGLRALQPYSGRFLLSLVLDTPDWFPDDMRPLVVPALRDVFPESPGRDAIAGLREVARDVDFEAQALREALEYALAQWGQRDLVQVRIDALKKDAGDGSDTDELHFVRALAQLHYELRDYDAASERWVAYLDSMRGLGQEAGALDLYNAACSMSRAGRVDDALSTLDAGATMVADERVDSTAEITREMFETDPDLRVARRSERFAKIVEKAFGKRDAETAEKRR